MKVKSIGLFGNAAKREIIPAIQFVREVCDTAQVEVFMTRKMARIATEDLTGLPTSGLVRRVDIVIALGGDGTMLRAARAIGKAGTPLLGINLGSLGYLTDVRFEDVAGALEQIFAGDYLLEERARVCCTAWRDERKLTSFSALNDIVINMGPMPRALDLELKLAGQSLGRFLGDGIIFSTPTGSTAYNLSAGGSICHSGVSCLMITPICPHSLGIRPLIVPNDTDIELILYNVGNGAKLTADGQETANLYDHDRVTLRASQWSARLVKFPQSNFYKVMRHKLNWGGTKRRESGG